jgi:hypothetical protein
MVASAQSIERSRHKDVSAGNGGDGVSRSGHGEAVVGPRHADGLTLYSPECVENRNSRKFAVAIDPRDAAASNRQRCGGTTVASEHGD